MKCLFTAWLFFLPAMLAVAQWSSDPSVNTLVRNAPVFDKLLSAVPDGQGGAILVFENYPDSLVAQRLSHDGTLLWGPSTGGKMVHRMAEGEDLDEVQAISDGAGGIIIGVVSYPPESAFSNIFLQRFSAEGQKMWASGGVRINGSSPRANYYLALSSDSAGGVYAAWTESDWETYAIVLAQRVNAAGQPQWAAGGIKVCEAAGLRVMGGLGTDAAGAAVIFFPDSRNDPTAEYSDIYGQRISPAGERLWTNAGRAVCVAAGSQIMMSYLLPDGAGGMIGFYEDYRNDVLVSGASTNSDIYAQRTDANGNRLWGDGGKPVCTNPDLQSPSTAAALGNGQVVVTWTYGPSYMENRTYAQCLDAAGSKLWAADGLLLTGSAVLAANHSIIADGLGNLQVAFVRVDLNSGESEVRAQKVNASGTLQWPANGAVVCNRPNAGKYQSLIVPSGNGAALIAWTDGRNEMVSMDDVYASKILANGTLASSPVVVASIGPGEWNNPNIWAGGQVPDANAAVVIRHQVIVKAPASCRSVLIEGPAGNLRVDPGIQFQVLQ
jgi:hypothetical protein